MKKRVQGVRAVVTALRELSFAIRERKRMKSDAGLENWFQKLGF